jgi:hypothetical protein
MREIGDACDRPALNAIHHPDEGAHRDRGLLRLAHLRGGNHLHGLGDLRRAADRSDATP